MHDFETIEEAEKVISEFIDRYNREWMLERLGYLSPNIALNDYNSVAQKVLEKSGPEHTDDRCTN